MIYYLAHPWKNNPSLSFTNAVAWTQQLRSMGKVIFSPILHTHPYWLSLKNLSSKGDAEYLAHEEWLDWDLALMEGFLNHDDDYYINTGEIIKYDSGLTVLLSRTAYDMGMEHWYSSGCKEEYLWAKQHHVRVLELESFLQGVEVDL